MRKIFTIAMREYRAMVGTKAFILSIVMMPILFMGGIIAMELVKKVGKIKELKIAVIDETDLFYKDLKLGIDMQNAAVRMRAESSQPDEDEEQGDSEIEKAGKDAEEDSLPGFSKEVYLLERIKEKPTDDLRIELSNRIKSGELYAFIEIPKTTLNLMDKMNSDGSPNIKTMVRFYAQDSSLSQARRFIQEMLNLKAREIRLSKADIDLSTVKKASLPLAMTGMGLVRRDENGDVVSAVEKNPITALLLPMGVMMLMFMVIFMSAQPMLESVLEEKSQRIAEVLLGSANPFQLMLGKLLGTVAGSLTVFGIYLIGLYGMAVYRGWTDMIPFELTPWFVAFQIVGVLLYASIFMAIGASVSQLKEAQAMLLPVWMMLMAPMFVWFALVREPNGAMATWFSMIPPVTPTTMMLRMATGQSIPVWQPIVGLVLTIVATLIIVVLAARIFRVGILWQGKTPKISEILKWAVVGS